MVYVFGFMANIALPYKDIAVVLQRNSRSVGSGRQCSLVGSCIEEG